MRFIKNLSLSVLITVTFPMMSFNAESKPLNEYKPVLEKVKKDFIPIDYNMGYNLQQINGGVYLITDGIWQSAFLITEEGVIVFDAPESYAGKIRSAIKSITDKPIKYLIYSHAHNDHIGGSAVFKDIKDLKIVSLESVSKFLSEKKDPNRLIPNITFKDSLTINLGSRKVHLKREDYHSPEGDIFIYVPHAKFLMAIDTLSPGYVPFMGFDLSTNFHEYLKVFDAILKYDFESFVGGHLTHIGNRKDVEIAKEFTLDVYNTTKKIHNNTDMMKVMSEAAKQVGWDNKFLLFKVFLDNVRIESLKELEPRWINRLAGVDVWLESHVNTALIYVRWDD